MLSSVFFGTVFSGQAIIPVGARSFTINVVSGYGYANGTLLHAGSVWSMSSPDSKIINGTPIAVGTTGVGTRVTYMYIV